MVVGRKNERDSCRAKCVWTTFWQKHLSLMVGRSGSALLLRDLCRAKSQVWKMQNRRANGIAGKAYASRVHEKRAQLFAFVVCG